MTRKERDQLISVMTELREFRRNTEGSLKSLEANVDVLMAAHNSQRGAAKLLALLWAGLLSLGGLLGGIFLGRGHG